MLRGLFCERVKCLYREIRAVSRAACFILLCDARIAKQKRFRFLCIFAFYTKSADSRFQAAGNCFLPRITIQQFSFLRSSYVPYTDRLPHKRPSESRRFCEPSKKFSFRFPPLTFPKQTPWLPAGLPHTAEQGTGKVLSLAARRHVRAFPFGRIRMKEKARSAFKLICILPHFPEGFHRKFKICGRNHDIRLWNTKKRKRYRIDFLLRQCYTMREACYFLLLIAVVSLQEQVKKGCCLFTMFCFCIHTRESDFLSQKTTSYQKFPCFHYHIFIRAWGAATLSQRVDRYAFTAGKPVF